MGSGDRRTGAPWRADAPLEPRPPLGADVEADVCVVGAGIAGLSVAYGLAREGTQVVVLEQGRIGCGETGRTTAHFVQALDERYHRLERLHGPEGARAAAESHRAAIDSVEAIVRAERIDCNWRRLDGYLFAPTADDGSELSEELAAARRAGVHGVELVESSPLPFRNGPALRFPGQAQAHPLRYLAGLARAIERMGGRIHERSRAASIEGGEPALVQTLEGARVRSRAIVVATHTPVNNLVVIHSRQTAFQTYAIAARLPHGSLEPALYWDTLDPYHYLRLGGRCDDGSELLIVGGEDHRTGQSPESDRCWSKLESWTRARFPLLGAVEHRWSGEVLEPNDGLAFIGRNPMDAKGVYVVTGQSGTGMTHGALAGILLADLLQERANPWSEWYAPSRKRLRAAGEFARENLIVAREYGRWLAPSEKRRVDQIERGQGAVLRRGVARVAVYVHDDGSLHPCSAACPHLGCVVTWNRAEKSWDCPCHGSRFDPFGALLHGPAPRGLAPIAAASLGSRTA